MNLNRLALIIMLAIVCIGCDSPETSKSSVTVNQDSKSQDNHVADERTTSVNESEWAESGGTGTIGEHTEFQPGDLVPCPKKQAEFSLDVDVIKNGIVFYRFSQPFCHFVNGEFDPGDEDGMNTLSFKLATLVGGSLSGSHFYSDLAPGSATIRIDWNITQDQDSASFKAEFRAACGEHGSEKLDDERKLDWSFNAVPNDKSSD